MEREDEFDINARSEDSAGAPADDDVEVNILEDQVGPFLCLSRTSDLPSNYTAVTCWIT